MLRDPAADMSLSVVCPRDLVENAPVKLTEGVQVIMQGKLQFHTGRGPISLRVNEIRAVGLGELLERIERLRKLLEAEGLFDPRLKRPLPFLPEHRRPHSRPGIGRRARCMSVAGSRWPAVRFAIRNTAVQGPNTVSQIVDALRELDADPDVDVIVIARGGGDIDALLPFYDETLCREIARCTTPVVSAIGHEPDNPMCDLVADLRAATPTDAAKHIVPDAAAESAFVGVSAGAAVVRCETGCTVNSGTSTSCADDRCSPRRWPRSPHGPMRCTAPAPRPGATSPAWWPPKPTGSGICRPGWPHLDRRRRWPAATPWCRPCPIPRYCAPLPTPQRHPVAGTGGRRRSHGRQRGPRRSAQRER